MSKAWRVKHGIFTVCTDDVHDRGILLKDGVGGVILNTPKYRAVHVSPETVVARSFKLLHASMCSQTLSGVMDNPLEHSMDNEMESGFAKGPLEGFSWC